MLTSNRNVEVEVKLIPATIRGVFSRAEASGATDADIRKIMEIFKTELAEYENTLMLDGLFYEQIAKHPYKPGETSNYTYAHLLHVLMERLENAVSLEERDFLRLTHYSNLDHYSTLPADALTPIVDKLQLGVETPNAFVSWIGKLLGKSGASKVKTTKKTEKRSSPIVPSAVNTEA